MRYLAFLFLVAFAAGQSSAGKVGAKLAPQVSPAFHAAAQTAYDSIKSLAPQAEASDTAFQPRQIEVEKNLAAAGHKAKTSEESRQLTILNSWAEMIDLYRWIVKNQGLNGKALDVFKVEDTCFSEAVLIFERASLSEQEKQRAKATHCVEDSERMNAQLLPTQ